MANANEAEIRKYMASELAKGVKLSDLQGMVNAKFGMKYTYMDIRIMASELDSIDWSARDPKPAEKKPDEPVAEKSADAAAPAAGDEVLEPETEKTPAGSATVVEISKLVRPGAALSGTVKFASGSTADWYVDQMGRLGLDKLVGAEPSEADVREFQRELNAQVEKMYGGR